MIRWPAGCASERRGTDAALESAAAPNSAAAAVATPIRVPLRPIGRVYDAVGPDFCIAAACPMICGMDAPVSIAARAPHARGRPTLALAGDERLAAAVGRGDQRAFATIYERYHQALYRYCRSILRDDADAQDALQTAMVGAFVALQNGRRDAPLRPWLFRIAHNTAISALRRRRPTVEIGDADGLAWGSAEVRFEERERLALLVSDLGALAERQRGALVMRELSGLSHEDIATALGITVGGAKQAIFEARRALLDFQEGREMSCEAIQQVISEGDGRMIRGRRVRAHLRECSTCATFAQAIPRRREALQLLAPPLAPIAVGGLLARLAGSGHGGGGAAAGLAGKSAAVALVAKTAAAVELDDPCAPAPCGWRAPELIGVARSAGA